MNTKQKAILDLVFELSSHDYITSPLNVKIFFDKILAVGLGEAVEYYCYLTAKHQNDYSKHEQFAITLCDGAFIQMFKKEGQRALKALGDDPEFLRSVYTYSGAAADGELLEYLLNAVYSQKFERAQDIMKALMKNKRIDGFGQAMKALADGIITEAFRRAGKEGKKASLPRNVSAFLLENAQKIKSTERAVVEQRIKEIM